jgi:hypothetical protein
MFITSCRGVVNFTPRQLYLWIKSLWYPLERRLGEHQTNLVDVEK